MEKIEVSTEFLASVLGTTPGALAEAFNPAEDGSAKSAEEVLKPHFQARFDASFQEGRKQEQGKAERLAGEKFEKEIQTQFNREKRLPVIEAIREILDEQKKTYKANPNDIRNSDIYISDVKALQDKVTELQGAVQSKEKEMEMKDINSEIAKVSSEVLKGFALPENDDMRNNNVALFLDSISKGVTFRREGDVVKIYDQDGEYTVKNDMRNDIDLQSFIAERAAKIFPAAKQQSKGMPPAPPAGGGQGGAAYKFTNTEEYVQRLNREADPVVRKAMSENYNQAYADGSITD